MPYIHVKKENEFEWLKDRIKVAHSKHQPPRSSSLGDAFLIVLVYNVASYSSWILVLRKVDPRMTRTIRLHTAAFQGGW